MHIALFGGAFDPPHIGHERVAHHILEKRLADQVLFVPANDHPFRKTMSPTFHRLHMLTSLITDDISVATWELEQSGPSYSIVTLEHFAAAQPEDTFTWIIGSDNLGQFARWHRYQDILDKYGVLVYPRTNSIDPATLLQGMEYLASMPICSISSTQVREAVRSGAARTELEGLVTAPVARYIQEQKLYTQDV